MRDMSAIPPAMPDIERTNRASRLLARLGLETSPAADREGGGSLSGSRRPRSLITAHSPTPQPNPERANGNPTEAEPRGTAPEITE